MKQTLLFSLKWAKEGEGTGYVLKIIRMLRILPKYSTRSSLFVFSLTAIIHKAFRAYF
jgi:hypothetical protein